MDTNKDMVWLKGTRGGINFLRGTIIDTGIYTVVSWKSGTSVTNKRGEALKVVVLGNMIEDVTGKNL
ncbi:MAG: hypothetical protein H9W81_07925 [Enterococcus sp.]|nr:hypothetical protein [Enterococcus sp.]